jgi:hypothetical protein
MSWVKMDEFEIDALVHCNVDYYSKPSGKLTIVGAWGSFDHLVFEDVLYFTGLPFWQGNAFTITTNLKKHPVAASLFATGASDIHEYNLYTFTQAAVPVEIIACRHTFEKRYAR